MRLSLNLKVSVVALKPQTTSRPGGHECLAELSADVDWLLFGPGVETGSQAQSWNLPGHDKYECGFFNARVGG